MQLVINKAN